MNLVKNIKMNTVDPVFDFPYIIQLEMTLHVLSSVYKDNLSLLIYILATVKDIIRNAMDYQYQHLFFARSFPIFTMYFFSVDNYSIQTVSSRPVEAITDIQ
ncbi:hypothetical protein PHYBLDRAFT_164603 [Phycomyces blakesleeanus NRRL 1555(-)]|uniref:Uncharacterized protein n=1 Tax=Phycomyces blakesleeanus (strain ATCC 8743b / DSM 1359 / FGSC 10004 / NBRC 33097 / NRRL 1555) TaxID=763407 RepID=A0A163B182_PHYB8|nr:hypothetical protein PHYBLDRAFT_169902 [Phycomyces blakesleeanus NRRL 1555(-)]XP_018295751.1 hypothetical protein PHYBLDRAFT_164603 [Phycomyces blakesleeanus NRRL 1555(-)]OAD71992.1 hypothetical protein PHYBLDRAFT_169902 [Phycomyces blakesleeanus NRRL 1555(-)]OAD77711.1 hypothetical protein PHYBLDRAFT_164603 [Phycomyces blakesleeanus NRRL 1555(-)]|eukprot:XP_018290032.1 hypothetical protein PHYBLDRAFT_169902 [Phycomyces blakesleeanus NRRL 1555(-)]